MCMVQSIYISVCCVATTDDPSNWKKKNMYLYLAHCFKHICLVFYSGQATIGRSM